MVINFLGTFLAGVPPELAVLVEIGIMIIIASIFGFIIKLFRQPLIPAYIITGIILGPLFLGIVSDPQLVESLSQIGVAFLIFSAGLEINLKKLKEVGKVASLGGIMQILILFGLGFIISIILGLSGKAPIYIGIVVALSSTMIVVKILADKREINSLHGRIIIGILLIQDIAAILALTILATEPTVSSIMIALLKAIIFAIVAVVLSKGVNLISRTSAKNQELLLLVSISFLFAFSLGAVAADLSIVIGAFFAGVALANSDYKTEIEGKIAPLRDFFSVIFFVALGMQLELISAEFVLILVLLLVLVLIVKPVIIMFIVRFFGYKKATSFFTGNSLAQTSEFSLIIVTLGFSLGHLSKGLFSTLVLLTIITMSTTTYMVTQQRRLIPILAWPLNIAERFHTKKEELEFSHEDGKKVVIFGCHRMGSLFLNEFENEKKDILVVDYDPEIIRSLINKRVPCIYGDISNEEVLSKANIRKAEYVISTVPDFEDNLYLVKKTREANKKAFVFIVANRISEARRLYEHGADYVILPQVIGGIRGIEIVKEIQNGKMDPKKLKKNHQKFLESIHKILY